MRRLCSSVGVAMILFVIGAQAAEGAIIRVRESSDDGGGSIMNDGSADVRSSNGSSVGDTSLMSDLGLTDGNLEADLLALTVSGSVTDPFVQGLDVAVTAELNALRLFGMTDQPCAGCAKLSDAKVGGSLGLEFDANGNAIDPANVLFAVNLVGGAFNPAGTTWTAPAGLASPHPVTLDASLDFMLTQAQVNFIIAQMQALGLGVGDVRIGLGARSSGFTAAGDFEFVQSEFGISEVPEPTSLLLFGTAAVFAVRRRLSARAR